MFYVTNTKECSEGKKKKGICPFLLLENSRPPSLFWEPQAPLSSLETLDVVSTCVGIDCLSLMPCVCSVQSLCQWSFLWGVSLRMLAELALPSCHCLQSFLWAAYCHMGLSLQRHALHTLLFSVKLARVIRDRDLRVGQWSDMLCSHSDLPLMGPWPIPSSPWWAALIAFQLGFQCRSSSYVSNETWRLSLVSWL